MTMYDFLNAHPVWGFIYLATICLTIGPVLAARRIADTPKNEKKEAKE